jgi:2-phospho-L-lactate guanylyltransferase (CobY/MobA/RfbA family)
MSIFRMAKPAAVALTVLSMTSMAATAQAQSGKRVVVAMAPADLPLVQEAKPAPVRAMTAPRAKHVASVVAAAAKSGIPDCFWCNRTVYVSGLSF